MPQNKHVQNWRTMLDAAGATRAAAEPKSAAKPDPAMTPEMQAAYERRRGPNYGKDINLPYAKAIGPANDPMADAKPTTQARNNLGAFLHPKKTR